jgi:hypothetical protein
MIDATGWIIITAFVLFCAFLVWLPIMRHQQWKRFALRRGGTTGGVFGKPFARFQHHGRTVEVESVGRREFSGTLVSTDWPDVNLRMKCQPNQWPTAIGGKDKIELQKVATDDAEFDHAYVLFSNNADAATKIFSEATRRELLRLHHAWRSRPTLSIEDGKLQAYRPHSLWTCNGLERMIGPLLEFFDVASTD